MTDMMVRWMQEIPCHRNLVADHERVMVTGSVSRGCSQGEVLSPIMWCMVVDRLIRSLNGAGYYMQTYVDDIVILLQAINFEVLIQLTQGAPGIVYQWCENTQYKLGRTKGLKFGTTGLQISGLVKYLRVTSDGKVNWRWHLKNQTRKFCATMWMCKRAFKAIWRLGPKMIARLYTAISEQR